MKIVHYAEPGSGGVKRHVIDLLMQVDVNRHSYIFAYSRARSDRLYGGELLALRARGIAIFELHTVGFIDPFCDALSAWQLVCLLWKTRPDVLHLHSSKAGGIGRIVGRLFFPAVNIIYVPHAMAVFRSRFYSYIECLLSPAHDLLVGVSASEREDFHRWAIEQSRLRTIAIPMGLKPLTRGAVNARRVNFTVVTSGRICYQKNARLFFETALAAIKEFPGWRFQWIGDFGDDEEALDVRAMLKVAGYPSQIEVTGWRDSPGELMASADVFCMFSRYESFGYVTAEAMQCGLPVLATKATGTQDLVLDGQTGLVSEANVGELVASLKLLASDPELRKRLGEEGRAFVESRHTIPLMCSRVEALYESFEALAKNR